jgi:hypothetical protein
VFDSAGGCPPGDPAAIAELAATLRRVAAAVGGLRAPAVKGWDSPAARRAGDDIRDADDAAHRAGEALRSCASLLDVAADDLAADQRTWRARQGGR